MNETLNEFEESSNVFEESANPVKNAALKLIKELLSEGFTEPNQQINATAKIGIAQVAFALPMAMIGTCSIDGTDLHFSGRDDGLYVCCGDYPSHCWKVS